MTQRDGSAPYDGDITTQLVEVAKDSLHLIQQEIQLARQETIEKLNPVVRSVGMLAAGGLLLMFGSIYLFQALVRLLATRMPHWLASLLSGGAFAAGGIALITRGRQQLTNLSIVPQKTINSLREDKEWILHQVRSRLT
jgi:hypothetical protein